MTSLLLLAASEIHPQLLSYPLETPNLSGLSPALRLAPGPAFYVTSARPRGDDVMPLSWRHVPPRRGRALRAVLPVDGGWRPELRRRLRRGDGGRWERSPVCRAVADAAQRAAGGRGTADRDGAEDGGGELGRGARRRLKEGRAGSGARGRLEVARGGGDRGASSWVVGTARRNGRAGDGVGVRGRSWGRAGGKRPETGLEG